MTKDNAKYVSLPLDQLERLEAARFAVWKAGEKLAAEARAVPDIDTSVYDLDRGSLIAIYRAQSLALSVLALRG